MTGFPQNPVILELARESSKKEYCLPIYPCPPRRLTLPRRHFEGVLRCLCSISNLTTALFVLRSMSGDLAS